MIFHVSQPSEDAASQYQPLAANIIVGSNLISGEPSSSSISYLANNVRELVELGNVLRVYQRVLHRLIVQSYKIILRILSVIVFLFLRRLVQTFCENSSPVFANLKHGS